MKLVVIASTRSRVGVALALFLFVVTSPILIGLPF
jgi:hypothetical protein